jgi:YNFM family putative membrane transporter
MSSIMLSAEHAAPASSRIVRTVIIVLTAFLTVVDLFATQAILPALTRLYGVGPDAMSLAVNASTLGMAVASLGVALIAHRLPRRRTVALSLTALAVPTALLAFAPDLPTFAALRIVQGLCMATAFTLTLAYLGEHFSGTDAAGAVAAYITGNVASNLFGRLMSAAVADHLGVSANFLVFAGLNLAGALLVMLTMRAEPARAGSGTRSPPLAHLRNPRLLAAFATGFCILFAFIGTFTFVNFVLVAPPLGLGMMALGLVYLVFLPSIGTTLLAGKLVREAGTRAALWMGLATAAAGLPLLLLPSLLAITAGLALVGIGTFLAQAVATGHVGRIAPENRGAANGLYLASYFAGGLVGTAVLGYVFTAFGWGACIGAIAVALAVPALLAIRASKA